MGAFKNPREAAATMASADGCVIGVIAGRQAVSLFLFFLSLSAFRELRALVVEMVLATDMSCHFQQIKAMKNFLQQPEA